MINFLFGNNLNTLLSTNIDENATIITVSTGNGASFPTPNKDKQEYFAITLAKYENDENTEICFVTSKDGDRFTVLRGQENTIPQKWDQGTKISNRITAEPLNEIKNKANQSDVDEALGNIDFKPYYKKSGDSLTGEMLTQGNFFWGQNKKTYLVGIDNSWYIKNSDNITLISFENGSVTLPGQYSSYNGNLVQTNIINNNGAEQLTFNTPTNFAQPVITNSSVKINNNELQLISNSSQPSTGEYRNTSSILWQFGDDTSMRALAYFQELVGVSNNLILYVSGGNNNYNYVLDNFGKFSCKNINIEQTIQANDISTNSLTIKENTLTLQSNNTAPDGNGFIHGNGLYFELQKRGVDGSIYLQEHPGIDTTLVFVASGGGKTSSMSFNNAGKLTTDAVQTNTINNNGAEQLIFNTPTNFAQSVITNSSVKVNNNELQLISNVTRPNTGGYRNTSAVKWWFSNDTSSYAAMYFQEHVGISNNIILNVKGGDNNYNYVLDNFGNITANNFLGTALQAKYADLAEYYISDQKYDPGTIVKIGGINEITTASKGGFFMGVISTNPGLKINEAIKDHPLSLLVALAGRVPVRITGKISKGDPITLSDIKGIATKGKNAEHIIGFALESNENASVKLVECSITSVGRC